MAYPDELSNTEILTLVVYLLGGGVSPVDVEDAAIEAFAIAPSRFCWTKYEDLIDLRTVYEALKKARTGPDYLKGTAKHGYMLTEAGLRWARQYTEENQITSITRHVSPSHLTQRERTRLESTRAYQKFMHGELEKITIMDFREFARVNDYFPEHIKKQRFERIENTIRDDQNLTQVWELLKARFGTE